MSALPALTLPFLLLFHGFLIQKFFTSAAAAQHEQSQAEAGDGKKGGKAKSQKSQKPSQQKGQAAKQGWSVPEFSFVLPG